MRTSFNYSKNIGNHLIQKGIKSAGFSVTSQITVYFIQLSSTIVLARILTPHDFGLVAMATSITMFFMMFRNLGLTQAIVQEEIISHEKINCLFWINFLFCIIITIILIISAPLIAWFFSESKLHKIALILSFVFLIGGISTQHNAILRRNMKFDYLAANEIIGAIISVCAAIIFAVLGFGYWALIARRVFFALSTTIGLILFCKWRPSRPNFNKEVIPMLKFGVNSLATYTVNYFARNFDKILLGWKYGPQILAYYDKAFHLFAAPSQQLSIPLTGVAVSTLSKLRTEPKKFKKYYLAALSRIAFVGTFIGLIFTVNGIDFILLILGPKWGKSGQIFSILGFGIGIMLIQSTNSWIHLSMGRADRWLKWGITNALLTIIAFTFGLPFGSKGIAIAYIISIYVLTGPALWFATKDTLIDIKDIINILWKYILSFFISYFAVSYSLNHTGVINIPFNEINIIVRIVISTLICISFYVATIIVVHRSLKPIRDILELIIRMIKKESSKQNSNYS